MKDILPGLDRVRDRFLTMLEDRKTNIASHAIAAWEADCVEDICAHLAAAQSILHQIAGSAGSLGFAALGDSARHCENEIISHLQSECAAVPECPEQLILNMDMFLSSCNDILRAPA
ncbi:MAG: Hpt domain-containing protein [Sulfitobacter sp.]|nr:Hpt domain-containing protein [Sulfitobacter sp.]